MKNNKHKVKIYQLITSINLGGAENIAFNLAENCSKEFEYVIVELFKTNSAYANDKRNELSAKNIRFITLFKGSKRLSLMFAPFVLLNLMRKEKPQIIHSHTDLPDFVLAIAIKIGRLFKLNPIKIIRTIHNTQLWASHQHIGKFTENAFYNDYIIGVSEASLSAYKQLRQRYNLPSSEKQQVIYNGCKIPIRENLGIKIDTQKINILFCGRFEYQKGIDILIERIRAINIQFKNELIFHIVGSGSYSNEVNKLAEDYENVLVYDTIPNIANKLSDFDFLLMPSRFEGLVLTSIEASLSRVPVIAAIAPGLSETLPTDWALNFILEDESSLRKIMGNIVKNELDLDNLKNIAFNFVVNKFTFEKMVSSYNNLYLQAN